MMWLSRAKLACPLPRLEAIADIRGCVIQNTPVAQDIEAIRAAYHLAPYPFCTMRWQVNSLTGLLYPIIALIGVVTGASLSAWYSRLNARWTRVQSQRDLYHQIKAELTCLQRHCLATVENIESGRDVLDVVAYRKAKYSETGMLVFDVQKAHILNINLYIDISRISLFSRNNEIEINEVIKLMRDGNLSDELRGKLRGRVLWRMKATAQIAEIIVTRIDANIENPTAYDEQAVNYYDVLRDTQRHESLSQPDRLGSPVA
jgi:hypothetical protein